MTVQIIGAKVQTMSLKFGSIKALLEDLRSWWASSGPRFVATQWKRLVFGCGMGCVLGICIHLVWRDRIFEAAIQKKWAEAPAQKLFEGFSAYRLELSALAVVLAVSIGFWIIAASGRYLRAWWTGITSFTFTVALMLTTATLVLPNRTTSTYFAACFVLVSNVGLELWRSVAGKKRSQHKMPKLDIPKTQLATGLADSWQFSSSDDPITGWDQDIIGRTAVVELLAEDILSIGPQSLP